MGRPQLLVFPHSLKFYPYWLLLCQKSSNYQLFYDFCAKLKALLFDFYDIWPELPLIFLLSIFGTVAHIVLGWILLNFGGK